MNTRGYLAATVTPHPTVAKLNTIMVRTATTPSDVAPPIHAACATIRWVLATGELPERLGPRTRIERWVALNENAQNRADLRFLP